MRKTAGLLLISAAFLKSGYAALPPSNHALEPVCSYQYVRLIEDAGLTPVVIPLEFSLNILLYTLICNPDAIDVKIEHK